SLITLWFPLALLFFLCTHAATTAISSLSLHDALPILAVRIARDRLARAGIGQQQLLQRRALDRRLAVGRHQRRAFDRVGGQVGIDRKSTRLNSSHVKISYAVFCLKKKNIQDTYQTRTS